MRSADGRFTLGFNGEIYNYKELRHELRAQGQEFRTESDSEVLLNVFAHELQSAEKFRIDADDVFRAIARVHERCSGGYAAVAMITGVGIVAFRDPYGIRPIVFGRRETSGGMEYAVASESVAIDALGFELVRDLSPGEVIFIDKKGTYLSIKMKA